MPDSSMSEALAEAAALAPADEVVHDTLEVRHPDFVDENGNPDSLRIVADTEDLVAPLEPDAPIKPGQWVKWTACGFTFTLPTIEPGTTPEIEITVDGVSRSLIEALDLAVASSQPIVVAYRPYLDTALEDGPQMDPVLTFEVVDVSVGVTSVTLKARTGVDLRGVIPIRLYTPAEHPGLIGR
jgi:hypothetical protein